MRFSGFPVFSHLPNMNHGSRWIGWDAFHSRICFTALVMFHSLGHMACTHHVITFPHYRFVLYATAGWSAWEGAEFSRTAGAVPIAPWRPCGVRSPRDRHCWKPHDQWWGDSLGWSHPDAAVKRRQPHRGEETTPQAACVSENKVGWWNRARWAVPVSVYSSFTSRDSELRFCWLGFFLNHWISVDIFYNAALIFQKINLVVWLMPNVHFWDPDQIRHSCTANNKTINNKIFSWKTVIIVLLHDITGNTKEVYICLTSFTSL